MEKIDNIEINETEGKLRVNPKVYPIEAVYSAAYVFLDRAYIIRDGNPEEEIVVKIITKEGNTKEICLDFFNELINYADYQKRALQSIKLREMILQRALFTNYPEAVTEDNFDEILKEVEEDFVDDPDDIAVPWEEKYGKKEDEENSKTQ
jgi:His-Xaa-Ser system protein HxsD